METTPNLIPQQAKPYVAPDIPQKSGDKEKTLMGAPPCLIGTRHRFQRRAYFRVCVRYEYEISFVRIKLTLRESSENEC